jgi:hypothetical protein
MFHSSLDGAEYPDYANAYRACWALLAQLMEHGESGDDTAADLVWSAVHGIATLGLAKRLRYGDAAELEKLTIAAINHLAIGSAK